MKKVEIKFMRFEHRFGRLIAMGQLFEGNTLLAADAPLAQHLMVVQSKNYELTNAQPILNALVVEGGFAS